MEQVELMYIQQGGQRMFSEADVLAAEAGSGGGGGGGGTSQASGAQGRQQGKSAGRVDTFTYAGQAMSQKTIRGALKLAKHVPKAIFVFRAGERDRMIELDRA
jgi:hypothetical protein